MSKRTKREKKPSEMTTQELAEHIFSKELKEKLDQIAHEKNDKPDSKRSSHK